MTRGFALACGLLGITLVVGIGFVDARPKAIASLPLRWDGDTRSAFYWIEEQPRFPQAVTARWRVSSQRREQPNPWEVAWLIIGTPTAFLAFVPKENGWHLECFDRELTPRQTFLSSGESPRYRVGEWTAATIVAWEGGAFVVAEGLFVDWRWSRRHPAPEWWGEPVRAGLYVEDCAVVVD